MNNKGKGLIDGARNKGQEIKGNSAWQRGKTERTNARNTRRTEAFARRVQDGKGTYAWISRQSAQGIRALPGQRADATSALRRIRDQARESEIKETNRARQDLVEGNMFSQDTNVKRTDAAGNSLDVRQAMVALSKGQAVTTEFNGKRTVFDPSKNASFKYGAMSQAAAVGDAGAISQMLDKQSGVSSEDQPALREFIGSNASSLMSKMPHLFKGEAGAFNTPTAAQIAGWHGEAATAAVNYAQQNPKYAPNIKQAFVEALQNDQLYTAMDKGGAQTLAKAFNIDIKQVRNPQSQQAASGGGSNPTLVVPRTGASRNTNSQQTPLQQQRAQGGNFNNGPGSNNTGGSGTP